VPGHGRAAPPAAVEETAPGAVTPRPCLAVAAGRRAALGACGDVVGLATCAPADVTAAGFVLADLDTGAVLAARAPHAPAPGWDASLSKLIGTTSAVMQLVGGGRVALDSPVVRYLPSWHAPGVSQITVRQLLTGLLLNSGNDTAQALARTMGGDAATVAAMADKARQLGALDTRPATPSGLDGPGMATSAYDLAVLFRHAMGEPLFAETIATREIPFPGYGDRPGFILSNANPLLARYPGTLGSKTGFTDAARHTIVAAAERNGRRLVVSLVRAENTPVVNWRQAAALLDYGFALPAGAPAVGTLVDAAPAPPTASAGRTGPAGTFTGPVTTGRTSPVVSRRPGGERRSFRCW
jgi:D-alanyl-D-alanine carboxypeptidase (penicillin-binding protein 5/6)